MYIFKQRRGTKKNSESKLFPAFWLTKHIYVVLFMVAMHSLVFVCLKKASQLSLDFEYLKACSINQLSNSCKSVFCVYYVKPI